MNEEKPKKWQVWLENKKALNRDFKKYVRRHIIRKIEPSSSLSKIHLDKSDHNLDFANFTVQNQENINKRVENEKKIGPYSIFVALDFFKYFVLFLFPTDSRQKLKTER